MTWNCVGMLKSLFKPISIVGENASERKGIRGYQYQCCRNIIMPTAPPIFIKPARDCIETTTFPPPASIIPAARIAPDLARMVWCLSFTTDTSKSLNFFTDGDLASEACCNTSAYNDNTQLYQHTLQSSTK